MPVPALRKLPRPLPSARRTETSPAAAAQANFISPRHTWLQLRQSPARSSRRMSSCLRWKESWLARNPAAKARALEMVRNLEAALKSDISSLSWMGDATRKQAIVKLDAFLNKIGYPDKWRDYSSLSVDRTSYVANRLRVGVFNERRDWNKVGKPVDRTEWVMSPPTVNAYYNPQINEIVFPAGILQPPYFDANADDALNYGGIGSVIGHEMTHGFDDQGRQFDAT